DPAGALGRLHHVREPGAGEGILGGRRAAARGLALVDRFVGRVRIRRALRRAHGPERGVRWIFFGAAAISLVGMLMVRGTPESKAESGGEYRFDTAGVLTFMVMMLALQVFATQGGTFGWTSPITL